VTGHTFAVEHIRPMRGCAQAQLLRCADGGYYVVKFQNNLQGVRILANDLLGTLLAEQLGLPIAQPAVVDVSEKLIRFSDEMRVGPKRAQLRCLSGLSFGSRYPADENFPGGGVLAVTYDLLPEPQMRSLENLRDYAGMLVFDKWTCNTDSRQTTFGRHGSRGPYYATMIDQGLCFNGMLWNFPDSPLRGLYSSSSVYAEYRGFEAFEPWLGRLENDLNEGVLQRASAEIPKEWYGQNVSALARLIETLDRRRIRVRDLLWTLLKASPRSFPNWSEHLAARKVPNGNVTQLTSRATGRPRLLRRNPQPQRDLASG
jgi:hypothetical protein